MQNTHTHTLSKIQTNNFNCKQFVRTALEEKSNQRFVARCDAAVSCLSSTNILTKRLLFPHKYLYLPCTTATHTHTGTRTHTRRTHTHRCLSLAVYHVPGIFTCSSEHDTSSRQNHQHLVELLAWARIFSINRERERE